MQAHQRRNVAALMSLQVDVYAFGVLLNEMVGREVPFAGRTVSDIKSAVLGGGRPDVPLSCPRVLQVRSYHAVLPDCKSQEVGRGHSSREHFLSHCHCRKLSASAGHKLPPPAHRLSACWSCSRMQLALCQADHTNCSHIRDA